MDLFALDPHWQQQSHCANQDFCYMYRPPEIVCDSQGPTCVVACCAGGIGLKDLVLRVNVQ